MLTDVEDNSWEEVYRANGVRCDIEEDVSSQSEPGVCPTPLANPFFYGDRVKVEMNYIVTLEAFA
ncbi:MAG: hypothetical protein SA339_07335 [Methanomassiliicoccus sp.]|nr:hypothetical protein [Methanomassiliicoccus sp.]